MLVTDFFFLFCYLLAETDATVSISNQADKVFFVFFVSLSTVLLTDS